MPAVAVEQVTRQQQVSKQESLSLMSQLLEVSVYHLTYLRQLFPEDSYRTVHMKQIDNMDIRLLKTDFEDGCGVGHGAGIPSIDLTHNSKKVGKVNKNKSQPTPETIRFEVVRMMRMLVILTNTLDEVEAPFYVTMKLEYHDNAPEDFELPAFQPMELDKLDTFAVPTPRMCREVGQVDTGHHKVALTLRSILDVEEPEAPPAPEIHAKDNATEAARSAGPNTCGTDGTSSDRESPGEDAVAMGKLYTAGVEAVRRKEESESPLQIADTPMTDSPQLQQAPTLKAARSTVPDTVDIHVPDMSRLKIGVQKGIQASRTPCEGLELSCPPKTQQDASLHDRKDPKTGTPPELFYAASTVASGLLAAFADKSTFTKDDAVHAMKNTSARRVDRALSALVKDGLLRKLGSAGPYEVVGNAEAKAQKSKEPSHDKKSLPAGRLRRGDAKAVQGGGKKKRAAEDAEDDDTLPAAMLCDEGDHRGMGSSQGGVVLCSQEKRRGAYATASVYQKHKRHRGAGHSGARAILA